MYGALENPTGRSSAAAATAPGAPTLLVIAAPAEWSAVVGGLTRLPANAVAAPTAAAAVSGPWRAEPISHRFHAVLSGIGKSNAAGAAAIALASRPYARVLSIGIAGLLGGPASNPLGSVILATQSIYADEGLDDHAAFRTCADLGFPLGPFAGNAVPCDAALGALLVPLVDREAPVATVSTCSGTDALAARVVARTGAIAEAMEGAAVGHIAARLGIPFAELRVLSNTTGDRARQRWDMGAALKRLHTLAAAL